MKNLVIGIVVLALVGAGFYFLSRSEEQAPMTDDESSVIAEEDAVVFVPEQEGNESDVVVSYAKLSEPGYVIIFLGEGDDKEIFAQSEYLEAGEHRNVKTTKRGGSRAYTSTDASVSVVADDGDQMFDVASDTEVLVSEDEVVIFEGDVAADAVTDEALEEILEEAGFTVVVEEEAEAANDSESTESSEGTSDDSTEAEAEGDANAEVEVNAEAEAEAETTN